MRRYLLFAVTIFALLFLRTESMTAVPNSPVAFNVIPYNNSSPNKIEFLVFLSQSGPKATKINLFQADTITSNIKNFRQVASIRRDSLSFDSLNVCKFYLYNFKSGYYSFFVKAADSTGESGASQLINTHVIDNTQNDDVIFTTSPVTSVIANQLYKYTAKAVSKDGRTVNYSLDSITPPAGMNVNTTTGDVTWAPTQTGSYLVSLKAFIQSEPGKYARQTWTLKVLPVPSDNDSLLISVTKPDTAYSGNFYRFNISMVVDVKISKNVSLDSLNIIASADDATVEGMDVELFDRVIRTTPNWAPGKHKFRIELRLKSDSTVRGSKEWTVTVMDSTKSPNNTNFAGYVLSRDKNLPVKNTLIELKQYQGSTYIKTLSTTTNDAGYYSIYVPKLYGYKLKATPPTNTGYKVQYYDGKNGATDEIACVIVLSSEDDDWVYKMFYPDKTGNDSVLVHGTVFSSDDKFAKCVGTTVTTSVFKNDTLIKNITAVTNQSGYYQMNIPDGFTYMFKAEPIKDSLGVSKYMTMYYDGISGSTDIKSGIIVKNEDQSDDMIINFDAKLITNYKNSLFGSVVDINGKPVPCTVILYLLKQDSSGKKYITSDQTTRQNAGDTSYKFTDITPGVYYEFFLPEIDAEVLVSFYNPEGKTIINWKDATRITINSLDNYGPIKGILQPIIPVTGDGSVSGRVQKDSMIASKEVDSPLGNKTISSVYLYAFDSNGKCRKVTSTNNAGNYELKGLAFEKYDVYANRIGFDQYKFTVEPKQSQPSVIQDIILSQSVYTDISENTPAVEPDVLVYPNPASEFIVIRSDDNNHFDIMNIFGQTLISNSTQYSNGENIRVNISALPQGMYLVRIGDKITKFVKK